MRGGAVELTRDDYAKLPYRPAGCFLDEGTTRMTYTGCLVFYTVPKNSCHIECLDINKEH